MRLCESVDHEKESIQKRDEEIKAEARTYTHST